MRAALWLSLGVIAHAGAADPRPPIDGCRCFPGDACWPTIEQWDTFNQTIGGRLIKTVPIGHVCHEPHYDADKCEALRSVWNDADVHVDSSHSVMSSFWANQSCDPFTDRSVPCVVGTYPQFVVNASSADDVARAIAFARAKHIRFVVRNTGHDYEGKPTGAGALSVWTHHLKALELVDWADTHYVGAALKLGAGVLAGEAYAFAGSRGRIVVGPGGMGATVGLAGGYLQGGGHSPLSSRLGLAADGALAYEVVDGTGRLLVATRDGPHADLYWALGGGGGGTFGVVLSATVRAHADMPVTLATLGFRADAAGSEQRYFDAVAAFHDSLPALVDAGCVPLWTFTKDAFNLLALTAPGLSGDEVEGLLAPFVKRLGAMSISGFDKQVIPFPNFGAYYQAVATTKGVAGAVHGGSWFTPRSVITDPAKSKEYTGALRKILHAGGMFYLLGFNVSKKVAGDVHNAVLSGWRDVLVSNAVMMPVRNDYTSSDYRTVHEKFTKSILPLLQKISPEAGTYLNEMDPFDPNWKVNAFGENYDRLVEIKNKYDPDHLFYGPVVVGSDYWLERPDKRLCPRGTGSSETRRTRPTQYSLHDEKKSGKDEL